MSVHGVCGGLFLCMYIFVYLYLVVCFSPAPDSPKLGTSLPFRQQGQSILNCLLLSIERYYTIVKKRPITPKAAILSYTFIWALGIWYGTFPFYFFSSTSSPGRGFVLQSSGVYCSGDWAGTTPASRFHTWFAIVVVTTSTFGCAVLYWKIFAVVRANRVFWSSRPKGHRSEMRELAEELEARVARKVCFRFFFFGELDM